MKRQKIKVKEKGRRVGFYPPLFTFYSSLSLFFALIFSVSATAQKVAILAPGKQTVPEFVEKLAEEISKIPELTSIGLKGLSGGKWSKATTDKTSWSFQILGITVAK